MDDTKQKQRQEHARRHRKEKELERQGVDLIERSRQGAAGQILAALPHDHPINRRKRAAIEGRRRRKQRESGNEPL